MYERFFAAYNLVYSNGENWYNSGIKLLGYGNTPPSNPVYDAYHYYAVLDDPTGVWAGYPNTLARYTTSWVFLVPGAVIGYSPDGSYLSFDRYDYIWKRAGNPRTMDINMVIAGKGVTPPASAEIGDTWAVLDTPDISELAGEGDTAPENPENWVHYAVLDAKPGIELTGTTNVPILDPKIGSIYLLSVGATGEWESHKNTIATYTETGWTFETPDESEVYFYQYPSYASSPYYYSFKDGAWKINQPLTWTGYSQTLAMWQYTYWRINDPNYSFPDPTRLYKLPSGEYRIHQNGRWTPHELTATSPFAWHGHKNELAIRDDSEPCGWRFEKPGEYLTVKAGNTILRFIGSWITQGEDDPAFGWKSLTIGCSHYSFVTKFSIYRLQNEVEIICEDFIDTHNYPTSESIEGLSEIPMFNINEFRKAANLEHADELIYKAAMQPPDTPAQGVKYAILWPPYTSGTSPDSQGAWAGKEGQLAEWIVPSYPAQPYWQFTNPANDYRVQCTTDSTEYYGVYYGYIWLSDTIEKKNGEWTFVTAGFTRKKPKEIISIHESGQTGQRARYILFDFANYSNPYSVVKDIPRTTPPENPSLGDQYMVSQGATGIWKPLAGALAKWYEYNGKIGWHFGFLRFTSISAMTHYGYQRTRDTETYTNIAKDDGIPFDWVKLHDKVVAKMCDSPPSEPVIDVPYAVSTITQPGTVFTDHPGELAKFDGEEWSFEPVAIGSVIRVDSNFWYYETYRVPKNDYLKTENGWVQLAGIMMDHDGEKWQISADQTSPPSVVTTYGRAEEGDIRGAWIYDELANAINQLKKTVHPVTWCQDPDDEDTIIQRAWNKDGSVYSESSSPGAPNAMANEDYDRSYRMSPWGKVSDMTNIINCDLDWYGLAVQYGSDFHAQGDSVSEDVLNLWHSQTGANSGSAMEIVSSSRYKSLTRPTAYPASGSQGYQISQGYVVAEWNFTQHD